MPEATQHTNRPVPVGSDVVVLRIPREAWETLSESLALDARSHAADQELRDEIGEALERIEEISPVSLQLIADHIEKCEDDCNVPEIVDYLRGVGNDYCDQLYDVLREGGDHV